MSEISPLSPIGKIVSPKYHIIHQVVSLQLRKDELRIIAWLLVVATRAAMWRHNNGRAFAAAAATLAATSAADTSPAAPRTVAVCSAVALAFPFALCALGRLCTGGFPLFSRLTHLDTRCSMSRTSFIQGIST